MQSLHPSQASTVSGWPDSADSLVNAAAAGAAVAPPVPALALALAGGYVLVPRPRATPAQEPELEGFVHARRASDVSSAGTAPSTRQRAASDASVATRDGGLGASPVPLHFISVVADLYDPGTASPRQDEFRRLEEYTQLVRRASLDPEAGHRARALTLFGKHGAVSAPRAAPRTTGPRFTGAPRALPRARRARPHSPCSSSTRWLVARRTTRW